MCVCVCKYIYIFLEAYYILKKNNDVGLGTFKIMLDEPGTPITQIKTGSISHPEKLLS